MAQEPFCMDLDFHEQSILGHYNHWRKIRTLFMRIKQKDYPPHLVRKLATIAWEHDSWTNIRRQYGEIEQERLKILYSK